MYQLSIGFMILMKSLLRNLIQTKLILFPLCGNLYKRKRGRKAKAIKQVSGQRPLTPHLDRLEHRRNGKEMTKTSNNGNGWTKTSNNGNGWMKTSNNGNGWMKTNKCLDIIPQFT